MGTVSGGAVLAGAPAAPGHPLGAGAGAGRRHPFALLDLATDHGFYLKMVVYHRLPYSLPTLRRLVEAFIEDHGLLFLVAAGYAAWRLLTRRLDLATCALLAGVVILPTAGVVGADSNHLLFLGFACAWCAAAALVGVGGWGLGVGGWGLGVGGW